MIKIIMIMRAIKWYKHNCDHRFDSAMKVTSVLNRRTRLSAAFVNGCTVV